MPKYRLHWDLARSLAEEWRLARDEYRTTRANGKPLPEIDDEASEIQARFRRLHPAKRPVEKHTVVFVQQQALCFGATARPPRKRRPVVVLRSDPDSKEILAAPMTTLGPADQRTLSIPMNAPGLVWSQNAMPRDSFMYDTPEFVHWRDVRRTDRDSPAATVISPLRERALAFVYMPGTDSGALNVGDHA